VNLLCDVMSFLRAFYGENPFTSHPHVPTHSRKEQRCRSVMGRSHSLVTTLAIYISFTLPLSLPSSAHCIDSMLLFRVAKIFPSAF
jgi:hypothetical protein